jgi:hypothetical protein
MAANNPSSRSLGWVGWAMAGIVLFFGWVFILWQNKLHLTAPVVMVCLGYLAVVATVASLWRVGAAAVAPEDASAEAWSRPLGERGELEKEKKLLLKAIKEAEFDQAMGKLSKADADALIVMYRGRAIEVIKALEQLEGNVVNDTRTKIQREIAARIALEAEAGKGKGKKAKAKKAVDTVKRGPDGKPVREEKFAAPPVATDDDVETSDDVETTDDKVKTDSAVGTVDDQVSTPIDDRGEDADSKEASS